MFYPFLQRLRIVALGLAVALGACTAQPEAITAAPLPAASPSPAPSAVLPVLTLEEFNVRFRYPPEYQAVVFQDGMCLAPVQEYGQPGPCHVQSFGLEVLEAQGLSLEQAADEAAAFGNPDIEVTRTSLTVGGEQAVLLDNIYAYDRLRIVVIVHGGRFYRLTFVPWAEDQAEDTPLGILYNTVIDSFEFLDAPLAQPTPESSSNLTLISANTFTSTSPNGIWIAEAVVLQFVEKDYARLKLYRQEANAYEEFIPYEEWSETGLGDSFLSDLYWSPDGRYLYFTHRGNADGCGDPFVTDLHRVDLQTGGLGDVSLAGIGLDVITLSPQADRLAYRTADGFLIRFLETGEEYTLPYPWREEHDYLVGGYAWSPDGKTLAFTLTQDYCILDPSEVSGSSIQLIDLETGETRTLTDRDPRLLTVTGWPDAQALQVYQDGSLYLYDIDTGTLTPDPSQTANPAN